MQIEGVCVLRISKVHVPAVVKGQCDGWRSRDGPLRFHIFIGDGNRTGRSLKRSAKLRSLMKGPQRGGCSRCSQQDQRPDRGCANESPKVCGRFVWLGPGDELGARRAAALWAAQRRDPVQVVAAAPAVASTPSHKAARPAPRRQDQESGGRYDQREREVGIPFEVTIESGVLIIEIPVIDFEHAQG